MIKTGCYYKINNRVVFARRIVEKEKRLWVEVYRCNSSEPQSRNAPLFFDAYQPCGTPHHIEIAAFEIAENLCAGCLDCIYCNASSRMAEYFNVAYQVNTSVEYKAVLCDMRSSFANMHDSLIVGGCTYRRTTAPKNESILATGVAFKKGIVNIVESGTCRITNPDMPMLPPNTFVKICSLLDKDEYIFLGSGDSAIEFGEVIHESLSDYIANPMEDANVICIRAGDASRDYYAYVMSELSSSPRYALLAPSIALAAYGDDITIDNSYNYGYSIYTRSDVMHKLLTVEEDEKRAFKSFAIAREVF